LLLEHRSAVEYDLLTRGYALRQLGDELPWHDAYVLITEAPERDSAVFRAMHPDDWRWLESLVPMLLAALADDQRRIAWANADPQTRGPEPPLIQRPGVTSQNEEKIVETEGVSKEEMLRRVMARNGRA